ncbi:hypothetical protein KP79_PYT05418 [Mizuhopecten yessoensis]|uniref:Uncharacterized protein n=1 Tax=Mizuhopecten yessoensis TaxID=6573 RepID=A0A210PFA5_MIZYE|nr:hypothetical protein KP79_PYT05418 [Mizuhopecten yessoensis]
MVERAGKQACTRTFAAEQHSNTSFQFEEIQNNSDQLWQLHRSQVIMAFQRRIPVTLNLLLRPLKIAKSCLNQRKEGKQKKKESDARMLARIRKQQQTVRKW